MFENAKELCKYDVAKFKKPDLLDFRYKLELLKINDPESYMYTCMLTTEFIQPIFSSKNTHIVKLYRKRSKRENVYFCDTHA